MSDDELKVSKRTPVETACIILRAGEDPLLWSRSQNYEKEKIFISQAKGGINLNGYGLTENEQMKLLTEVDMIERIKKLVDLDIDLKEVAKLNEQETSSMIDVLEYYPETDVFSYIKAGYSFKETFFTVNYLRDGIDSQIVNQIIKQIGNSKMLDGEWITYLKLLIEKGFDVKPFMNFSGKQLSTIYSLYLESGKDVVDVIAKKPEFYQKLKDKDKDTMKMLVYFELYGLADAESILNSTAKKELPKKYRGIISQRVQEIVAQESENDSKYDVDYIRDIMQNYQWKTEILQKLLNIHHKGGRIIPFLLLYKKSKKLFENAKWYFEYTQIDPSDYIVSWDFDKSPISEQFANYLAKQLGFSAGGHPPDTLMVIYNARKRGIDLLPYALTGWNASAMEKIAEYIEKGKPVPPPGAKPEVFTHFDDALELYAEYGIDLFKFLSKNVNFYTARYSHIATYILKMLNATKHNKEQFEKTLQSAHKLINVGVRQGKHFDRWQLKQIHLGILQGIDITEYAEPDYSSDMMAVMRKGLKAGISLKPYVDYIYNSEDTHLINTADDIIRHVFNLLTDGDIPDIRVENTNKITEEPFIIAVALIEQFKSGTNNHSPRI